MDAGKYSTTSERRKTGRGGTAWCVAVVLMVLALGWWGLRSPSRPLELPKTEFTVKKAVAVLRGDSDVVGTVEFTQHSALGHTTISGTLLHLDPDAKRGFHIHALGDTTSGCTSAGSHFNPFGKTHGAPGDHVRHVGDLGNIQSNSSGIAEFSFTDPHVTLNGPLSIIGRSVVVHAGTDDLGKGGDEESLKTGNAGGRAACGVIGLAELA